MVLALEWASVFPTRHEFCAHLEEFLGNIVDTAQVDIDNLLPLFRFHTQHEAISRDAGIIH